jgi:hypothetical protein
MVFTGI